MSSAAAAVTRARSLFTIRNPMSALRDPRPRSLRGLWHRASMLGTLALLLFLPWLSSRGCEGDQTPTPYSGYELLQHSIHDDVLWVFAPVALLIAAQLPYAASRV